MEEGRKVDEGPEPGWVVPQGEQVPVKGKPPTYVGKIRHSSRRKA